MIRKNPTQDSADKTSSAATGVPKLAIVNKREHFFNIRAAGAVYREFVNIDLEEVKSNEK